MATAGRCFHCDEFCGAEDFCNGCGVYICVNCTGSPGQQIVGHDPEAHVTPDWWPDAEPDEETDSDE